MRPETPMKNKGPETHKNKARPKFPMIKKKGPNMFGVRLEICMIKRGQRWPKKKRPKMPKICEPEMPRNKQGLEMPKITKGQRCPKVSRVQRFPKIIKAQ